MVHVVLHKVNTIYTQYPQHLQDHWYYISPTLDKVILFIYEEKV